MASIISDDENYFDDSLSDSSQCSRIWNDDISENSPVNIDKPERPEKIRNIVKNILSRQIFGKFAKNPRAKTEKLFSNVHPKCKIALSSLIQGHEEMNHIFMGFTLCGQFFISFTVKVYEDLTQALPLYYDYELYLWRFIYGQPLKLVSKHKIFKHLKGLDMLDNVLMMQFPADPFKLVCYGLADANPSMAYVTILTLPAPKSCKHCRGGLSSNNDSKSLGWCKKHGFILHYMFSMSQPCPSFDPKVLLAYPDHFVINTGHYIHILNVNSSEPPQVSNPVLDDPKLATHLPCAFSDNLSEVSESPSEHFGSSSVIDAILEDFSEYDLESNECNKPFHELNISCEPLNVTGKSYHNTLVQNIVDPRMKRLQNSSKDHLFSMPQTSTVQKSLEKAKIDKKIAEKAYEFIEENEKCEKLSLFRKKRLAEKKYEFSEDNSENIVPFNSLRRERRYLYKTQSRIRSPDFNSIILSARNSGIRSPIQSPNSRNGQFSPSGARNALYNSLRNSPHHSKSPISPRESARKFSVYSPNLESDCSDSDSRLIMRTNNYCPTSSLLLDNRNFSGGLLIVNPKNEKPKWIKKLVRRYSNGDFENSSLVSGQSRDDYNIPIEIPLLVQTLNEQHLDIVPDFRIDQVTEMQLIVTQRTLDCEHFVQKRAQKLCLDAQLEFLHCEDYDIKIIHICPLDGHIICQAVIKIGALKTMGSCGKPESFTTQFQFSWNIATDKFEIIDHDSNTLHPSSYSFDLPQNKVDIPVMNCKEVLVMNYCYSSTKTSLRDCNNFYEVCLNSPDTKSPERSVDESDNFYFSDSD